MRGTERQERSERKSLGHEWDRFRDQTGKNSATLRNQLAARNHANQRTMRVSDMAAIGLHVRNPIMSI